MPSTTGSSQSGVAVDARGRLGRSPWSLRSARGPGGRGRPLPDGSILGYFTVAPAVAILALLVVYPFLFSIWISFTSRTVADPGHFIGFRNYLELLGDPDFRTALRNSVVYVGAVQAIKLVLGLGIASLLSQQFRGRNLWRGLVLLPWAMPGFVAYVLWKLLYDEQGGAFNTLLLATGLSDSRIGFLSDPSLALPSVILATVWQGFPFWVIMFVAAMHSVPTELYEAAHLDGANAWQRFRNVTVPGIRTTILVVLTLSTIWTTNAFQAVWLTTQGGPSNATTIVPVYAYLGLQNLQIGRAAADSLSLVPIFVVFVWFVSRKLRETR
ncbi:carbohydrate ABC transporter permease [Actinopolymorpha pittospori]